MATKKKSRTEQRRDALMNRVLATVHVPPFQIGVKTECTNGWRCTDYGIDLRVTGDRYKIAEELRSLAHIVESTKEDALESAVIVVGFTRKRLPILPPPAVPSKKVRAKASRNG